MNMKEVNCCEKGKGYIRWKEADEWFPSYGPEFTGFAMLVDFDSLDSYGIYDNVNWCPFCGTKL